MTSGVQATGIDVEQTATDPGWPAVRHGRFRVRNSGAEPARLAVTGVVVRFSSSAVPVGEFFVYRLPGLDEAPADALVVAAGATDEFEVSFAEVPLEGGLASPVAVEVALAGDAGDLRAVSRWTGVVRTPRR